MAENNSPTVIEQAPEPVELASMQALVATPGATIADEPKGRNAQEKTEALADAGEQTADVDPDKTLFELAVGNKAEQGAAIQTILYMLERHFNIDFIREAPQAEVTAGIAAARAAMSFNNESPQYVDDRINPPGTNNPTDDVLPPNIPTGDQHPGRADDGNGAPAKSASREDWDAYAESRGLNPADYSSKEELQTAVENQEG